MLVDEELHPVPVALDDRTPAEAFDPRAAVAGDLDLEVAPPGARPSARRSRRRATTRPRLTITTSSQTSSTRSSWCELNTTPTPAAARSRRTSVIVWTPSGSRPENGSSRTSSSGSWTSAVASWIRCWLPWDRSSSFDFARSARPNRSSQTAVARPRVAAGQPVVLGEVRQLLADAHPRVEPALLGHVPEPQPRVRVDGRPVPATPRRPRGRRARRCSASSSSCRRRWARGSRAAGHGAPSATHRRAP